MSSSSDSSSFLISEVDQFVVLDDDRKRKRSKAYDNYTEISNGNKICKFCDQKYSKTTSTNILYKHIKSKHPMHIDQSTISPSIERSESFEEKLIKWIISDFQPLNIVNQKEFIEMIRHLSNNIQIPSRDTIRRQIMSKFSEAKNEIRIKLEETNSKFALTTDLWTSISNHSYMAVTAHFIDNEWKSSDLIIRFTNIPFPHTGRHLAEELFNCVKEFNIHTKIISITTDDCSNNSTMFKEFRQLITHEIVIPENNYHIICLAHSLNLAVQKGL